jgi:hypothetical protein
LLTPRKRDGSTEQHEDAEGQAMPSAVTDPQRPESTTVAEAADGLRVTGR